MKQEKKEKFCLTDELRETVRLSFAEMHSMFSRGYTPTVKNTEAVAVAH